MPAPSRCWGCGWRDTVQRSLYFSRRNAPGSGVRRRGRVETVGLGMSGLVRRGTWTGAMLALGAIYCAPAAADPLDRPALFSISEIRVGALEHDTPGLWRAFSLERA